jgi:hypothetical protein
MKMSLASARVAIRSWVQKWRDRNRLRWRDRAELVAHDPATAKWRDEQTRRFAEHSRSGGKPKDFRVGSDD